MDNGPARKINTSSDIQAAGDILADPFEISTIRRDVSTYDVVDLFAGSNDDFYHIKQGAGV